jgi:electron-transferring-flavoprotein dehydrogenase
MGDELVTVGFVAGLEAKDVEFSVHDVLQEFKTHRLVWKILRGGERVACGVRRRSRRVDSILPRRFNAPGLCSSAREPARERAAPEGVHYAIESGDLAAEAAFRRSSVEVASRVGALDSYDASLRESRYGTSCTRCATCARPSTRALRRRCVSMMT